VAILVAGASGFLGSRLVESLVANGHEVIALAKRPASDELIANPQLHWLIGDIAQQTVDLAGFPEIEAVVHLAGASLGASQDEHHFLRANEEVTVRLLQAVADRTKRIIYASSQAVYGDSRHLAVTEEFPLLADGSAYGCSKVNCENWLRWFQARHGGQYLALRFCGFVEGGGLIDYIIDQALAGNQIDLYSQGKIRRDYLPVSDAISVLVEALTYIGEEEFLPVNIGSGQIISAHELAILISTELLSTSLIELNEQPAAQGDFVFCVDRARQLFNFQPGSLAKAVRDYALKRKATHGMS
jgi:UDP-glucose 4-epimerase